MAQSGMISGQISEGDCATIWNNVPPLFRIPLGNHPTPKTSVELMESLALLRCLHPTELARALGDFSGEQDWETSIGMVTDLQNHECPRNTPAPANPTQSRLFKASDVPEFTNTQDYDGYRSSLLMFFQSEDAPAQHEFGRALLRILGTFKDPTARSAAQGWDVTNLIHPNWEETYQAFLLALDKKFQSATILEDSMTNWMKCRPKPEEKPSDFFNRYEASVTQLTSVQTRSGIPPNERAGRMLITNRLLQVLPKYLVDDLRLSLSRQQPPRMIEMLSLEELRPLMERSWAYLPKPANHNRPGNNPQGRVRSTAATNETKPRQCGLIVSYDSNPPVPQNLRGAIYPDNRNPEKNAANLARRRIAANQRVCEYCRRPASQHQAVGTNFKQVTMTDQPTTRAAITAPPPRLLLEAAPSPDQ